MISIGIIGTGIVGERIIKQLQQEKQVEIKMVYDQQAERLEEISEAYGIPAAKSVEDVLHSDINWVYIATPPAFHSEIAELAASAGINILCEKPLAHDVEDGEAMVKSVADNRVQTAMHFPLMYKPEIREMAKRIKNGQIGKVVRIELQTFFPDWPRLWQQNPWIASRSQGGFVREVFPHYFQLMNRLFGELSFTSHHITYPEDAEKCETGLIAHGLTQEQIPFLLTGISGIGQQENLQFKIYGETGVLTLENWSDLYESEKGQERRLISGFENVPSLFTEMDSQSTLLVNFEEGLVIQRYIDYLLTE
ncbi:Gfo/Idh/MocA family oxidoreductase [Microbacterium sp. APC 3898]|uniref:Gfo/Idh/MocA family oxidoreductase n=2 Tax=Planococcus TaxID=1372 RepID=A0ABT7ZFP0_9BACL|nr:MULTISPECIES: Gfo/Idh/MocA family oxidoreductase [Terrabacteria group]MBD8013667.1 Gfo/Idh/MocA family oxidoreductase [Planococcus wigleyi]MDN3425970.1 Gfo/Idh/MocA family oxidoreductase [Planococcus sp. APC 4016]MDN3437564.1 Gfo/Idh/MocA family oxidoreductase [Planococcus sp. APC 3900]MDN3497667.1 Gfo/Idh/MocA family oxidoreductase [Microbacterium sp. APC 3898]